MSAVSLTDLQQQIAARERELKALRQELESRQGHLTELTRRKEELQRQLQQVEKEITALAATTPSEKERPQTAAPSTPPPPKPAASVKEQPRLGELILTMLRETKEPMTARQLSEEARRRGFQPIGRDPVKSVEARLQDLKNKGSVRRAANRPGYILAPVGNGTSKPSSKPTLPAQASTAKTSAKPVKKEPAAKKPSAKGSSTSGAAKTTKAGSRGEQPSLRAVLTGILKNSRKLLSGSELAERARAAGYQGGGEKFVESVWSMLGKMDNVEHLRGQGYRLKR
jgi:hypothetical protein